MDDNVSGRRGESGKLSSRLKGLKSCDRSVYVSSEDVALETRAKKSGVTLNDSNDDYDEKESKRSGTASVYMSSEEYYICDPCEAFGDHAEAEGFCVECNEYLCITCFMGHSRNKASKHHNLLSKDNVSAKSLNVHIPFQLNINQGTTERVNIYEKYKYAKTINIKSSDEKDCYVTEMLLISNNELVLCDNENQSLKLVDIDKDMIKDTFALQSKPIGITAISIEQVAVVLENYEMIQIVRTRRRMSLIRTIKTKGNCVNIKMTNKHLYVSFRRPVKFKMLQPTGTKIKTIKPDVEVLKHCTTPLYFAVNIEESLIYVSDWDTGKLLSLDMNGNMIAIYQGELGQPMDIKISICGSLFVCDRKSHSVYKMHGDLSNATVVLGVKDGIEFPEAICLNTNDQYVYISSGSSEAKYCNVLNIYKYI